MQLHVLLNSFQYYQGDGKATVIKRLSAMKGRRDTCTARISASARLEPATSRFEIDGRATVQMIKRLSVMKGR